MKAELAVQENPEQLEPLVAELTRAKARADELKQRSARWQITLNDGVGDLQSDIDYDLRDRLRTISREAEQLLDDADPAEIWEQFANWFHQQVASAASANFVWAAERARYLSEQVAQHFAEAAEIALPDLRFDQSRSLAQKVDPLAQPDAEGFGVGQKIITGMRGGYGGMLMIGMATTLAGLALLNPISIGAGLLFGTKTVRDERRADAAAAPGRGEAGGAPPHRRGDLPGRQGLPRHAAPHPAPAARPLQRARRGGEHLDRELGAGRAERRQHHDVGAAEPHPRPQGRAGPHRRARRPEPGRLVKSLALTS